MSERQFRKYAAHKRSCKLLLDWKTCTCGLSEALSQPPDVVVLLRWLTEWRDTYTDKLTGYLYAPPDMASPTIEAAINEIEKTVRLTDDGGWEWVDEGE